MLQKHLRGALQPRTGFLPEQIRRLCQGSLKDQPDAGQGS
jgi:hypothetical protein